MINKFIGLLIYIAVFMLVIAYCRKEFHVKKNNIYVLDRHNRLKQDVDSFVRLVAVKKVKWHLIRSSIWECYDVEDYKRTNPINVPASLLDYCNTTVIRYPLDIPDITRRDIEVLSKIEVAFDDNHVVINKEDIKRYKAIISKLKFFVDSFDDSSKE